MRVEEIYMQALSSLGVPVSQEPAGGKNETYITFNQVYGSYVRYRSNRPGRVRHQVQVHVFSRRDDGTHRALMRQAIQALSAAGAIVVSWGPDEFEDETGYNHIAITTELREPIEKEETP